MPLIFSTLDVSHFDISGNDINDSHPQKILFIFLTLDVSQLEMSGNDFKEQF